MDNVKLVELLYKVIVCLGVLQCGLLVVSIILDIIIMRRSDKNEQCKYDRRSY